MDFKKTLTNIKTFGQKGLDALSEKMPGAKAKTPEQKVADSAKERHDDIMAIVEEFKHLGKDEQAESQFNLDLYEQYGEEISLLEQELDTLLSKKVYREHRYDETLKRAVINCAWLNKLIQKTSEQENKRFYESHIGLKIRGLLLAYERSQWKEKYMLSGNIQADLDKILGQLHADINNKNVSWFAKVYGDQINRLFGGILNVWEYALAAVQTERGLIQNIPSDGISEKIETHTADPVSDDSEQISSDFFSVDFIRQIQASFPGYKDNTTYEYKGLQFANSLAFGEFVAAEQEKGTNLHLEEILVQYATKSAEKMTPAMWERLNITLAKAGYLVPHLQSIKYVDEHREDLLQDESLEKKLSASITLENGTSVTVRYILEGPCSPTDLLREYDLEVLEELIPFIEEVAPSDQAHSQEPEAPADEEEEQNMTSLANDADNSYELPSFVASQIIDPTTLFDVNKEEYLRLFDLLNAQTIESVLEEMAPQDESAENFKVLMKAAIYATKFAIMESVMDKYLGLFYPLALQLGPIPVNRGELNYLLQYSRPTFINEVNNISLLKQCKAFLEAVPMYENFLEEQELHLEGDTDTEMDQKTAQGILDEHLPLEEDDADPEIEDLLDHATLYDPEYSPEHDEALEDEEISEETKKELSVLLTSKNIGLVAKDAVGVEMIALSHESKNYELDLVLMTSVLLAKFRLHLATGSTLSEDEIPTFNDLLQNIQLQGATTETLIAFLITRGVVRELEQHMYKIMASGLTAEDMRADLKKQYEELANKIGERERKTSGIGHQDDIELLDISEQADEETSDPSINTNDVLVQEWVDFAADVRSWTSLEATNYNKYKDEITGLKEVEFSTEGKNYKAANIIDFFFRISKNGQTNEETLASMLYSITIAMAGDRGKKRTKRDLGIYKNFMHLAKEKWSETKNNALTWTTWSDLSQDELRLAHTSTIEDQFKSYPELSKFLEKLYKDPSLYEKLPSEAIDIFKKWVNLFIVQNEDNTIVFKLEKGLKTLSSYTFEEFEKLYISFMESMYMFSFYINVVKSTLAEEKMVLVQQYQRELNSFLSKKSYTLHPKKESGGEKPVISTITLREIIATRNDRNDLVFDMYSGLFEKYEKDLDEAKQELVRMGFIKMQVVDTQPIVLTLEVNKLKEHAQQQEEIIAQLTAISQKLQEDKLVLEQEVARLNGIEPVEASEVELKKEELAVDPAVEGSAKETSTFLSAWEIMGKKSPSQKRQEAEDAKKAAREARELAEQKRRDEEESKKEQEEEKKLHEKFNIKEKLAAMRAEKQLETDMLEKKRLEEEANAKSQAEAEEEAKLEQERKEEQQKLEQERTAFQRKAIDFELAWDETNEENKS